ncbi:hypothetical protein B0T24DRAFT_314937 [Lasiosphaeria ovina]|uniref:Gastric mucin-like protein n=1 Tax=Lasiosphaeria ovina TaxID=92902 RepID=A0AAE0N5C6_9PEZI|nr:hypothetical protein B0T24DRAFT_314937 [Lasiosphaeria ovina]
MAKSPEQSQLQGNIVAFEGPLELVSTQLRLLPTSPQILVLPSLRHYLSADHGEQPFAGKHVIRQVHDAAKARHAVAVEFLRHSTVDKRRIVFMDGGTVGAQVSCLSAISKNQTDGDIKKAESMFNRLASKGVAGLLKSKRASNVTDVSRLSREVSSHHSLAPGASPVAGSSGKTSGDPRTREQAVRGGESDRNEDPITRAMRAADALYMETDSLQPPTNDMDLSARSGRMPSMRSRRSLSLSALHFADIMQPSRSSSRSRLTQSYPVGFADQCLAAILQVSAGVQGLEARVPLASLSWVDEASDGASSLVSPSSDYPSSRPSSPDRLGHRRIRVASIRLLPKQKQGKRSRSLERSFLDSEDDRSLADMVSPLPRRQPSRVGNQNGKQSSSGSSIATMQSDPPQKPAESEEARQTGLDKSSEASSARTSLQRSKEGSGLSGADAGDEASVPDRGRRSSLETESSVEQPFEPILPLLEDLVIHFAGGVQDDVYELVLKRFRKGGYSVSTPVPELTIPDKALALSTFTPSPISPGASRDFPHTAAAPSELGSITSSEYYGDRVIPSMQKGFAESRRSPRHSPTPSRASTRSPIDLHQKFHTLNVGGQTAASIQNTLRSIFGSVFPLDGWGYRPSHSAANLEMQSMWKPIFSDAGPRNASNAGRRTDLILAIGAENGVKRDYVSLVVGQIEKLGSKSSGRSRSGHLDLRYLIANAMQAFTCQPLTRQARENPFTDSALLASLVIPHLETYICSHPNIRFLIIEYPAEHLSTVLALQQLIGADLLKVACILNGDNPAAFQRPSSAPPGFGDASEYDESPAGPQGPFSGTRQFSKANYLLTHLAAGSETASFVASIRETLVSISDFYVPEVPPRKGSLMHQLHPHFATDINTTTNNNGNNNAKGKAVRISHSSPTFHPKVSPTLSLLDTPPSSPLEYYATRPRSASRPLSPTLSIKSRTSLAPSAGGGNGGGGDELDIAAFSVAGPSFSRDRPRLIKGSGAASPKEAAAAAGRSSQLEHLLIMEEEYGFGESDAEERRLMPLFLRRQADKGNSQKALKWLGLE